MTQQTVNRAGTSAWPDARRAALIAGWGYVVLFFAAFFANFFVRESLIDSADPSATAANIAESETLFRWGLLAFLVIFVVDVVIAWALHVLLRTRHHDLSLLAAWLRLMYTAFLGVAVIFFFEGLNLLSGNDALAVIPTEQLQAQAVAAFEQFNATWMIGLAAFGLHLIVIGVVLLRTGTGPRLLGLVLAVAGAAYLVDTTAYSLLSDYGAHQDLLLAVVAIPSIIGEGWFGLWLVTRAGRDQAPAHP
jgi:hypothetical protein